MTSAARVAVLERIAKYAREDRAVTPRVNRLARALDELDRMPAEPSVVWVVTNPNTGALELCGVYDNREAAVSLVGGFGADTSVDPGGDEVTWRDKKQGVWYTVSRREVMS